MTPEENMRCEELADIYQKRLELQGKITKLLSVSLYDTSQFTVILKFFVEATGADLGCFHRISELGEKFEDLYVSPDSSVDRSVVTACEERIRNAIDVKRGDAQLLVRTIREDEAGPASITIALLLKSQSSREVALETLNRGIEILEPIFRARVSLRKRDTERRKAEHELKSSEEELRRLFVESKDMIYTANIEDRIASINAAGLELLGIPNRFDVLGRAFSTFAYNSGDRDFFLARIKKDGFVRDYEIVINRKGKEPAFCIETAHAIRHADGSIAGVQGIVKDISERIKNEKELWKTNLELAEANSRLQEAQLVLIQQEKLASIGQLAAGVAHEINNPLGFLRSNHQSLKRFMASFDRAWKAAGQFLPTERRHEIEETEDLHFAAEELPRLFAESDDGFARIVEIVSQLKAFSRVDSEPHRAPYNLERGIESTLVVAWNEIKYVSEVKRVFAGVRPVEAEGGAINQVLLNVLVNASQAIASQGRKEKGLITIETREEKDYIECSISDDGPGMTEDIQRRIFDPFFTTKEPGKGTGLGLSISYDIIVNKHQGCFSVKSEPGKGSTFTIALPIQGELGDNRIKG